MTLVASLLAGDDCIDDADALRAGGSVGVRNCVVKVPSTLGTFMRSLRWGHMSAGRARIVKAGESAGIHQSRMERLKVRLSRRCDTHREPYSEMPARILRHWVAIGHCNDLMALPSGLHWQQAHCSY